MAATAPSEAKAKVKAEAEDKEVKQNQEHLQCKILVLKVPIHCEECKRKVKKILTNIDGVYKINIDLRQHKVIVTGDVDVETLIRKLEKKGKRAELWPEIKAEKKKKKKSKAKSKEKQQLQSDQESSDEGNNSESAADKRVGGESDVAAEKSGGGGGGGGKKKKKKGNKGNNGNNKAAAAEVQPCGDAAPAGTGSSPIQGHFQGLMPPPASYGLPHQHGYHYSPPPNYNAPPVKGVSYDTAYGWTGYHASRCSAPTLHSYPYMQPVTGTELPSSEINSYPSESQPCNSFEIFSDENPNACSIM